MWQCVCGAENADQLMNCERCHYNRDYVKQLNVTERARIKQMREERVVNDTKRGRTSQNVERKTTAPSKDNLPTIATVLFAAGALFFGYAYFVSDWWNKPAPNLFVVIIQFLGTMSACVGFMLLLVVLPGLLARYSLSKRAAAGTPISATTSSSDRITHLLILVEREPAEGRIAFIGFILDELYHQGLPYRNCVDKTTEIVIKVVGPQNFEDQQLLLLALFSTWGSNATAAPARVSYQRFSGRSGTGVTVEVWR